MFGRINVKWRRRLLWTLAAIVAIPVAYVGSYFFLCRHVTGETFDIYCGHYTWHDRFYDFDPKLYSPLGRLECKLRGPDTQVVLDGSLARDGSAQYIFWTGDPKF